MVKGSGLAPLQSLNRYSPPETPEGGLRPPHSTTTLSLSFECRERPNSNNRLCYSSLGTVAVQ